MKSRYKAALIALGVIVAVVVLWLAAFRTQKAAVNRYVMTGIVVAVHPESGTASVHNDNIPGFMKPMEMDYNIKDPATLARLKRGDNIRATLVSDGQKVWELENIGVQPPADQRP